jgi:gamma-glutamyltranspeptidase/glutathione hydrolase
MGLGSADYLHTVTECAKLAFADREAWYGDPAHVDVPLEGLLSDEYARDRSKLVADAASDALRPGSPDGRVPRLLRPAPDEPRPSSGYCLEQIANGLPTVVRATQARGDTCTVVVTDRHGNMVAAVPSGGWLKSSPVVPGLGFPLGTRGQMMLVEDGYPNSLAPGRRPRTTLSPSLVLREGRPYMAFGTPGGDRQDQWTLEFFLAATLFGLDLQSATETLAFHTDHYHSSFAPHELRLGSLTVERNCAPAVIEELRRRGHEIELAPAYSLGKVCAVGRRENGFLYAAASPRGRQPYAVCR